MAVTVKNKIDELIKKYEKRQERLIVKTLAQIMALFDARATEIAFLYAQRKLIGNRFLPKDVRDTIETITNTVNAKVRDIIINGIRLSFRNSEQKNDIVETQANGRRIPPGRKVRFISAAGGKKKGTITAVDEFIKRKQGGLSLSQRVFKLSNSYKKAINDTLLDGLGKGTSARELATSLRKNLRNNKFTEHPGKGVYKSPQKNALRLSRNEINLAHENADFERWQLIDSVIGIQIKLSARHPRYDICDEMDGRYPKDFRFIGWHVNCLCIAVPILAPQEIRDAIMDYKLGLIDKPPVIPYITDIPESAKGWMRKNSERVQGWSNKPFWIASNKKRVGKFFE